LIEFNRSQRLGLDVNRHIALDAGAGTGKTTVMAQRYIQHLLTHPQRATLVTPPGPRDSRIGSGTLRSSRRDRTPLEEWPGLLPQEVVAITFTRKAAAELKQRIRTELSRLSANPQPVSSNLLHEPRLRSSGDVEMLSSLLDEAPISTIDSFLASLVSTHLDLVSIDPARDSLEDDQRPLLESRALKTLWRLRSIQDAIEAGVRGDVDNLIESRDRLLLHLGGRSRTERVINGMLSSTLFVDEARRNLIDGSSNSRIDLDSIRESILSHTHDLESLVESAFVALRDWIDVIRSEPLAFNIREALTTPSRYSCVDGLIEMGLPQDDLTRLRWINALSQATISAGGINSQNCSPLKEGRFPPPRGWEHGIPTMSRTKGLSKVTKEDIKNSLCYHASILEEVMNTPAGYDARIMGGILELLDPWLEMPGRPLPGKVFPERISLIDTDIQGNTALSSESQVTLLQDLFTCHDGARDILSRLKTSAGLSDHDDIQRLAEGLLLSRCPDVVRMKWPPNMVAILDRGSQQPWSDDHLLKAIDAAGKDKAALEDLGRRIDVLNRMRRRFRAFIIDEYQDTNPQQHRLIARLWGHRQRSKDEPIAPAGPWEPTICVVGDAKQSIYRFRQAQVSVMAGTIKNIRAANRLEATDEHRLSGLIRPDAAYDPRTIPGEGGSGSTFEKATNLQFGSKPKEEDHWVSFRLDDEDKDLDPNETRRRRDGHISLYSNHRTAPHLLELINRLMSDVLDEQHDLMSGDWHARSQRLRAGRETQKEGKLEWLIPAPHELSAPPKNYLEPVDDFRHHGGGKHSLEHSLLAARLGELLTSDEGVRPEDVLILVHSRTHVPALIRELQSHGIPAQSDRLGPLLNRPISKILSAIIDLHSNPAERSAALVLARSPVVGLDDDETDELFMDDSEDWVSTLHLSEYFSGFGVIESLYQVVDESDLMTAYPFQPDRSDALGFIGLVESISNDCGGEPALIAMRLRELRELGIQGPSSRPIMSPGAVTVMTIHAAKGLEAPVVVIPGIFSAGASDKRQDQRDNVMVTPELIAARGRPRISSPSPGNGLWEMASRLSESQSLAERRRLLYVALTRARDRLILVGAPPKGAAYDPAAGVMMDWSGAQTSFGDMLLTALINLNNQDSVWYQASGVGNCSFILDAKQTASDAEVVPIQLFNTTEEFNLRKAAETTLNKWLDISQATELAPVISGNKKVSITKRLKMAPHSLDVANTCIRRHWLSTNLAMMSEPFNLTSRYTKHHRLPDPQTFGLMMHRLLEVGIGNPAIDSSTHSLPSDWLIHNEDQLNSEQLIDRIIAEMLPSGCDVSATKQRMTKISELISKIDLGPVQGLRTELSLIHEQDLPTGSVGFNGRADLVIAVDDGTPSLQVIDLKTEGCITTFDENNPEDGHPLQWSEDAREELLEAHALQLTLYSIALEAREQDKTNPRVIKPPALLIAASGDLIEMSQDSFIENKNRLLELLTQVTVLDDSSPPESIAESEVCEKCPFHSGEIELCGPIAHQ